MIDSPASPSRLDFLPADVPWLSGRSTCLVLLFGAALLLPFLGSQRAISYHEMIFAQPAKEMLATGDWLLPRVAGTPSNHKPPLTHWSIAVSMLIFGSEQEWVARIPSVLAALWTAWVIAGLTARWLGDRLGLLAGLIQLSTYYLLRFGRLAESDMSLAATVVSAMAAFAVAHVDSPHGRSTARSLPWAFYLAAGLSFLVKGPIGLVFIFGGCLAWQATARQWPSRRFWLDPLGLLLLGLLTVSWPTAAYLAHPQIADHWLLHNVGRFQGELHGQKHPLYYVYSLPAFMLPWTPLAVQGWFLLRRQPDRYRPLIRFVACWLVPGLIVLSASAFKRKHYALPLLPPLSLFAAVGLHYFWFVRAPLRSVWQATTALTVLAAGSLGAFWVYEHPVPAQSAIIAVIVIATFGLLMAALLRERGAPRAGLAALAATICLVFVGIQWQVAPQYDSFRSQRELAQRINAALPAGRPLYLVHVPENQITYYLQGELMRYDKEQPFARQALDSSDCETYAVMPKYIAERLGSHAHVEVLDQCTTVENHTPERSRLVWVKYTPAEYTIALVKGVD